MADKKSVVADKKAEREARLAKALRENLKRRKAGREVLRGTAARSGVEEFGSSEAESPLHHVSHGSPPRPGED